MCYSIPGKVVRVNKNMLTVDYFGEKRVVVNELVNISPGDYIYAQGGFVIEKVDKDEAIEILDSWKDRFAELKQIDAEKSRLKKWDTRNEKLLYNNKGFSELNALMKLTEREDLDQLYSYANNLRYRMLGNACCVHGIIEFSNYCRNNCAYCGIRQDNIQILRYRMTPEEIILLAQHAINKLGFKALVLQSGEDLWYTDDKLEVIIKEILVRCNALLFLSIGNRSIESYKRLYDAGARGALIRFETSNQDVYKQMHSGPKEDYEYRINLIHELKKMGYIVASGGIIGLPGQNTEDIVKDILLARELKVDMYSFGPFIPHPQTPLAGFAPPSSDLVLKTIAIARIADPSAKILITTATENLIQNGLEKGLLAGANSFMINITPVKLQERYNIYPRKRTDIKNKINSSIKVLQKIGRAPVDIGV